MTPEEFGRQGLDWVWSIGKVAAITIVIITGLIRWSKFTIKEWKEKK